jgi:transcriptional regulator with XRE-family HTH domain
MMKKFDKRKITQFDIEYFRGRQRNHIFQMLVSFFLKKAEEDGLTKKRLAEILGKEPSQITRWLAGPGNLTLDTISDLLLAMGAEMKPEVFSLEGGGALKIADDKHQGR